MTLDAPNIARVLKRRGWIVIVVMIISGSLGYLTAAQQPDEYSSTALLLVSPAVTDSDAILTSQNIADTYRVMITSRTFLDHVAGIVGDGLDAGDLESKISTTSSKPPQFIEVRVSDPSPDRAALIAGTIATEFQAFADARAASLSSGAVQTLLDQRMAITEELGAIDEQISGLATPAVLATPVVASEFDSLNRQRDMLQSELSAIDGSLGTFNGESAIAVTQVEIIEAAEIPEEPAQPHPTMAAALGLAAGLVAGLILMVAVVFIESSSIPPQEDEE